MNSKECEEQLKSLVEAWDLKEATLNQTDIEAIKHLLLENEQLKNKIDKAIEYINRKILDAKLYGEQTFSIGDLLEILKGSDKE